MHDRKSYFSLCNFILNITVCYRTSWRSNQWPCWLHLVLDSFFIQTVVFYTAKETGFSKTGLAERKCLVPWASRWALSPCQPQKHPAINLQYLHLWDKYLLPFFIFSSLHSPSFLQISSRIFPCFKIFYLLHHFEFHLNFFLCSLFSKEILVPLIRLWQNHRNKVS